MSKKQFKAESKRMLDLMINSIYTNREIFLREIISNASDAIDKRYYEEAKSGKTGLSRENFEIRIEPNKDDRTLTISDNGIGMSAEELEENLGIIAKSGSLGFKTENEEAAKDTDIIGQFGVGFYSAFMVAKHIEVTSRKLGEEQAHVWISDGADGYSVEDSSRDEVGTTVQLTLRDDTEDDKYDEFLEEYRLRSLVTKYSDYIRYPIVMNVEKSKMKEASEEEKAKEDYQRSTRPTGRTSASTAWCRSGKEEERDYRRGVQRVLQVQILRLERSAEGHPHQRGGRDFLRCPAVHPESGAV